MAEVVFVDIETTGLDPERHHIFEIALIDENGTEREWWIDHVDLSTAEPMALALNGYYDREPGIQNLKRAVLVAAGVARLTAGKHLCGASPSFDARFLDVFLRRHGLAPAWSHRLIDVESLAMATIGSKVPLSLRDTAAELDIDADQDIYRAHTALGDARLAKAIYLKALTF